MRPLGVGVVLLALLAVTARVPAAHGGPALPVAVVAKGWGETPGRGSTSYSYGIVLTNRSRTADAWYVTVSAQLLAGPDGVLDSIQPTLTVIPAGQSFYLGAARAIRGTPKISALRVSIVGGYTKPKHVVLPTIKNIRIDRAHQRITGQLTNPYSTPVRVDATTEYVVVFDRQGHVTGGGDFGQFQPGGNVAPGASAVVSFPLAGVPSDRAASARISVDPH
jgi:hypothetical protein